ncbi:MAG: FGGY family carbohydrate kinase [Chitinophagaceae bacterium]|nr:FGGY family carbohydrate kinase [Chitinophagaceae bacterium]
MLLLGIDVGTSSVKVSVLDAQKLKRVASANYPEREADIISLKQGWAEQNPEIWWEHVTQAILKCHSSGTYNPKDICAVGIAYQMHGLVITDKENNVLRNSIIWCDSRAIDTGKEAESVIGEKVCRYRLLNAPGNFTASKLGWVKKNEPETYRKIHKVMLPGDFIALKLTGNITTTISALSEGIFWDFSEKKLSDDILSYFGFSQDFFPEVKPVFSVHGCVTETVAGRLGLKAGIPVAYKAGDQPNNAFFLNVMKPGEVAATAGTSGVVYAVSDRLISDPESRVNSFAHVNYSLQNNSIGVLLCINGCGISNRWMRNLFGQALTYETMNEAAATVPPGSDGLLVFPFGNGAERMLGNKIIGAEIFNIDYNFHTPAHLFRATQEGIVFAFRYGLEILKAIGIQPEVIRAGKSNLFLSKVFTEAFVNSTGIAVELYEGDGSVGAAIGAGTGAGIYASPEEAFASYRPVEVIEPSENGIYDELYYSWKEKLNHLILTKNNNLYVSTYS